MSDNRLPVRLFKAEFPVSLETHGFAFLTGLQRCLG